VYLVQVSLLFIGQHGLGHFSRYRPLLPIDWRLQKIFILVGSPTPKLVAAFAEFTTRIRARSRYVWYQNIKINKVKLLY
jgi:hypothetical protein